ncbi:hypothetical protein QAD02_016406 [Eretmocerus hayati]|uniref:Uncharacterized protein n=1 Tax=Eretmocerus hayati TaxID=131215 RepID=A0ACC2PAJ0_9HYME|nr:hypothetical protein QAD02_016406 [Eretmocerus hayati]
MGARTSKPNYGALYFPQSDLSLRIPYIPDNGIKLESDIELINVRTLDNDSRVPEDPHYEILAPKEKFATLDEKNGNIVLQNLPKAGSSSAILVQAKEKNGAEAFLEIKIQPQAVKDGKLDCSNFLQDMCFWNTSKYRVYENQPMTLLGSLGPEAYKNICPHFFTSYELLNGTEFFHLVEGKLYSNEFLDRDTSNPPKGTGPQASAKIRCTIWDETTGMDKTIDKTLKIDILDQNDNPPVTQTNRSIEIHLKDFTQGDRLDEKDLLIQDADDINSNSYSVKLLEDVHNLLNLTYDIIPIDHPKKRGLSPATAIIARLFAKTTLLPKSPYRVVLQVKDETLLPGFGNNTLNMTLTFIGPQHHTTTTTASIPTKSRITYPSESKVSKGSGQFYRVAQPFQKVSPDVIFTLRGPVAFNITRSGGIIFVSNTTALQLLSPNISLRIEWRMPDRQVFSISITVMIIEPTEPCKQSQMSAYSCANSNTPNECESRCGIGTGTSNTSTSNAGGCVWRSNKANSSAMTENYETCSPNISLCPNYVCDELEHLDLRICPQDCVIESETRFAEVNKNGRGIRSGIGTCWCDEYMVCTCGTSFRKPSSGGATKETRDAYKTKRERDRLSAQAVSPDARKVLSSGCGPACLIGIVGGSFFVLLIGAGSFVIWRYRFASKVTRRGCLHRGSDATNGLGILPLDYVDRGDGLLIGLESLAAVNRTLLAPKASSPDPKWEFPRERLSIEQVLGEGEFGRVLKAKAQDIGGTQGQMTVAVKTLKEDASASELADLLSEYQLLKEVHHPNVIRLLGACTSSGGPVYLVIEFAELGSLRNYLRRSRHLECESRLSCLNTFSSSSPTIAKEKECFDPIVHTITARDILSFAWQISKGMAYLADIKLVHRDLAARNVLLAAGKVCKISDFGLTRDVYEDDAYLKRSKGRVPVKWMAPESLADHVYTSKSDVWSFGVLLWELVTLGASPYPGVDVHNLYNLLKAGYRMEKPVNCSPQLYKLMVSCWHEEPGLRPSFKELTFNWERMLEDAVEYLDLNPRAVHNQEYFTSLHALDSPSTSGESMTNAVQSYAQANNCSAGAISGSATMTTNAVNYLSKPHFEPVSKCDKVDKLGELWRGSWASSSSALVPTCSSSASSCGPNGNNPSYVNEPCALYESPIRLRNPSVASSSENESGPSELALRRNPSTSSSRGNLPTEKNGTDCLCLDTPNNCNI